MKPLLADLILVTHALLVFFNVFALPVIWIGYWRKWRFIRNFSFRLTHLVLIGVVAAESVFGIICPLTRWEEQLRGESYDQGFVAHWIHKVLFFDLDPRLFTAGYVAFLLLVGVTFYLVPPERKSRARRDLD